MSVKSTDLVLIVFTHNWDAVTSDGAEAEDLLDISIVHKPQVYAFWDDYRDERRVQVLLATECGSHVPDDHGYQTVPRKFVNMRNVRKCQRASCFGGKK